MTSLNHLTPSLPDAFQQTSTPSLTNAFQQASTASAKPVTKDELSNEKARKKKPVPFSLRLSVEERADLDELAGNRPLGAYIREELLGDQQQKRRVSHKPTIDNQKVAQLLAVLRHSNIASNLNQLAKAVNCGNLTVDDDVQEQLERSCAAVLAMREALFEALGLKTHDPS